MHTIIFIHGLANKPAKDILHNHCQRALLEGLKRNRGLTLKPHDLQLRSAYWADLCHPKPEADPGYESPPGKGPLPRRDHHIIDGLRIMGRRFFEEILEAKLKILGVRKVLDELLAVVVKDLQVHYWDNPQKRELIRKRFLDQLLTPEIAQSRVMVIAHSMGSIIAYDAMRLLGDEQPRFVVDNFVTIGSPLGLPLVTKHLKEEFTTVRTPSIVHRWHNFADILDPVAADADLTDDFPANAMGVKVEDTIVDNPWGLERAAGCKGGGFPNHSLLGYLRCPEVSDLIAAFL